MSVFTQFRYLSADGKTQVAAFVACPPEGAEIRGVVQLCHGMCEYMERYAPFAAFLTQNGYVFCGNDHLGHGQTAPNDAELGYTGRASWLVADVYALAQEMRRRFPGKPYLFCGHSMGSFVARRCLREHPDFAAAAVLIGTGGPGQPTGLGKLLARLMMLLRGTHHRSALLNQMAFGLYNRRFTDSTSPYAWLSRDVENVRRYEKDKFCTYVFTARGFYDLFDLLGSVSRRSWAKSLPKSLPVLLMSGEEDPVGGYGKGVTRVYERLKAAGMTDVQLKLYPHDRHEILNEVDRERVYQDFLAFCARVS